MGKMKLTSPAFKHNEMMPKLYTCQDKEINPPLVIRGVPRKAKSLALIMTDPDTPFPIPTVTHWVICHMDPKTKKIEEGSLLSDAVVGKNMLRRNKYMGPCPPFGRTHRYFFCLYALDEKLSLTTKSTSKKVLQAIKGHVLEEAKLVGLYKKEK